MDKNRQEYFESLGVDRQLTLLQNEWGASPTVSLDIVTLPGGRRAVVASAAVLNALLAAELGSPVPAVMTRKLDSRYSFDAHITALLTLWVDCVKDALAPDPPEQLSKAV
jgi:hypothetical protein